MCSIIAAVKVVATTTLADVYLCGRNNYALVKTESHQATETYCTFLETSNLSLFGAKSLRKGLRIKKLKLLNSNFAQTMNFFVSQCNLKMSFKI